MCEQCEAACRRYVGPNGERVLPDYSLVRANRNGNLMRRGDWGLVRCNDPDYVWSVIPVRDPEDGMSDKEIEEFSVTYLLRKEYNEFDIAVENLKQSLDSGTFDYAIILGEAIRKAGYKRKKHGSVSSYWLCNHIARFLETAKIVNDNEH